MEDLGEDLIDGGQGGEAIALLESHTVEHPLRDRGQGLLIRALASVGRQADALSRFHQYRQHLAETTGTTPSAEVIAIERSIAQGWDGLGSPT